MRRTPLLAIALAALALTGCSAAAPAADTHSTAALPAGVDRTVEIKAAAGELVTKATETEPGRIDVQTGIIDPRGDDGSLEAQEAIAICNTVVTLTGAAHVSIFESDGTSFVLYGHPTYGNVCTEV